MRRLFRIVALLLAISFVMPPPPAEARHGAGAFLGGAILGAAIASSSRPSYYRPYSYYAPSYGYGYGAAPIIDEGVRCHRTRWGYSCYDPATGESWGRGRYGSWGPAWRGFIY